MHFPRSDTRCLQKKSGSVLRSERNIARYGIAVIGWMLKPSFVAVSHRRWNALPAFRYSVSSEEVRISAPMPEEEAYFFAFLFQAVFEKTIRISSRRHCQKLAILKTGIAGAGSSIVLI